MGGRFWTTILKQCQIWGNKKRSDRPLARKKGYTKCITETKGKKISLDTECFQAAEFATYLDMTFIFQLQKVTGVL